MKVRCSGYTFLEILIALIIFSAMLSIAGVAFNQGLRNYEKLEGKKLSLWEETKILFLQRSFASIIDYYVLTGGVFHPYFIGKEDMCSYVSLNALTEPRAVIVYLVKERESDGSFNLTYYEIPLTAQRGEDLERALAYMDFREGRGEKLLKDLRELKIEYFGFDQRRKLNRWMSVYHGREQLNLPRIVKLEWTDRQGHRDSLYLRIFAESGRKWYYNEIYR